MKQVSLRLRDGRVEVFDVPPPTETPYCVLVDVRASLLSVGTERSRLEAAREGPIGKARARPDQARQVLVKARHDGLRDTIHAVRARLDQPTPLGYSAAGVVMSVGTRVRGFAPGDRVACGGGEHAVHAGVVSVPGNLCVRLPDEVSFEAGAFATVASVAMHGVRQADVRIGERVAVIGLGLVGQLTGQILRAAGCHVVGIDLVDSLVEKARRLRSVDVAYDREGFDRLGIPAAATDRDAVIITAATRSADPIELAAKLLRDRGRVVVVGDAHVEVPRAPYYEREIEIRFSRSYGPGRYDREYEERGLDYPIGYVRWTEQRNMAAFVDLVAQGRIDIGGLITERMEVERAAEAYGRLLAEADSPLGIVLQYASAEPSLSTVPGVGVTPATSSSRVNVIGAGSFAQRILIPSLVRSNGLALGVVASAKGLTAKAAADRFGFAGVATPEEAVGDTDADLVAIATRHASHAALAEAALRAGKAVFVEKPPCLTSDELEALRTARAQSGRALLVGFNRRHAPFALALRDHVREPGTPIELLYRVSAEPLAPEHWLNDPDEGGGRLVGEGCHFIDFARWVIGTRPVSVACVAGATAGGSMASAQRFVVALSFVDSSVATVIYGVEGSRATPKEYVEAHSGGRSAIVDDYRTLTLYGRRGRPSRRVGKQDKGHSAQFESLIRELGGAGPAELDPLDSMATTLEALAAMHVGVESVPHRSNANGSARG
jgi:predicted dehydrogenase/threonine dehydrogenase-like Zn-dependent dehydrogenase